MIVEGLLTTRDRNGQINVAPMGPVVDPRFASFQLRPFAGSTTFQNLLDSREAVFHIVDRVDIIAEAAIRRLTAIPETRPAAVIEGAVLADCCRWYELRVTNADTSEPRSVMTCEVVHEEELRPFWGFNRARHAVLEAAILATRLHLLPREQVESQFAVLASAVEKTGGPEEAASFEMLSQHCNAFYTESATT